MKETKEFRTISLFAVFIENELIWSVSAVAIVHRPSLLAQPPPLSRSCSSDGRHTRYLAIAIAGPTVTMLMVNFTLFYTFTSR